MGSIYPLGWTLRRLRSFQKSKNAPNLHELRLSRVHFENASILSDGRAYNARLSYGRCFIPPPTYRFWQKYSTSVECVPCLNKMLFQTMEELTMSTAHSISTLLVVVFLAVVFYLARMGQREMSLPPGELELESCCRETC